MIYIYREALFSRCLPKEIIDNPFTALDKIANSTQVIQTFIEFFGQYRFFNELSSSFYTVRYDIIYLMLTALGESTANKRQFFLFTLSLLVLLYVHSI